MSPKYNPFKPNHPVFRGMFAGRENEIDKIKDSLYQTKEGNPTHLMIFGERGIGKTSLLLVAKYFSNAEIPINGDNFNFLSVQVSIRPEYDLYMFAKRLHSQLKREICKTNKELDVLKKTWGFIQRLEIAGTGLKQKINSTECIDELSYAISDTAKMLRSDSAITEIGYKRKRDGIIILIDETDNACPDLNLGTFLKNLSEFLVSEGVNNVLFVLAGLPSLRKVLSDSHPSSLRLFQELELKPLNTKDIEFVINSGLKTYNEKVPNNKMTIDKDAMKDICFFSEGYPHFVQQIGYTVFEKNDDNKITKTDVSDGLLGKGGAFDLIGDRYYKDIFYDKINVESYRHILRIMSNNWNNWITKAEIRKAFKGKDSVLNNGIKALKNRNIILSRKGYKGQYRLQWLSFAFWIKHYTEKIQ